MNKKIIVFIYCLFSIPFMSIHGWETFDKLYECRSSSSYSEDTEGNLECWVCDKNNTPKKPDDYKQAVIYCYYESYKEPKKKNLSFGKYKLVYGSAWIKLPMPEEIIKKGYSDYDSLNADPQITPITDPQMLGTDPIGVDKIRFIKNNNKTSGLDAWAITLHRNRRKNSECGWLYTYVIIARASLDKSLDDSLLNCKYKDGSPYITIINSTITTSDGKVRPYSSDDYTPDGITITLNDTVDSAVNNYQIKTQ